MAQSLGTSASARRRVAAGLCALFLWVAGLPSAEAQTPPLGAREVTPTCPIGSVLIDGRCAKPKNAQACPPGTVGHHPVCRPAVRDICPAGTAGVYPNCRPTVAPSPGRPRALQPPFRTHVPEVRRMK